MTSFIHTNKHSAPSSRAERAESGLEAAQQFSSTRGIALLLFSAMAAAVIAVAYEVMDTTAEAHLLVMWMGLWAALFAALVLLASMGLRLKGRLDAWAQHRAEARADARLWAMAQKDERLMADLQVTMMRGQAQAEAQAQANAALVSIPLARAARAERALKAGISGARGYAGSSL
ncbi:MAG: hypothetical protein M3R45_06965 [Pseudomonadota bacterium]|nr:hypothetical protein [Pseudomonadota bacterium]